MAHVGGGALNNNSSPLSPLQTHLPMQGSSCITYNEDRQAASAAAPGGFSLGGGFPLARLTDTPDIGGGGGAGGAGGLNSN